MLETKGGEARARQDALLKDFGASRTEMLPAPLEMEKPAVVEGSLTLTMGEAGKVVDKAGREFPSIEAAMGFNDRLSAFMGKASTKE